VATLAYRLRTFDGARLRRRAASGQWLAAQVPNHLALPGHRMEHHTHWLFPVVSSNPDALIQACRDAGIDGARGASSVSVVGAPPSRPESEATEAARMMPGLLFLPAYPELTPRSMARLVAAIQTSGSMTSVEVSSRLVSQA
jgi:dTDP-4-amino-4,6-dideoxygalactose transaminase